MSSRIRTLLEAEGFVLERVAPRGGSYTPVRQVESLAYTAGQLPFVDGEIGWAGQVGAELSVAEGQRAAIQTLLNAFSALETHLGTLDRVKNVLQVRGYVRSAPGFAEHHLVLNPLSDLLGTLFAGEPPHVRTAMGVSELPKGAAVELELIVEVHP